VKKDFFENVDQDDFWMTMALMFASRSPKSGASLLVESNKLLYAGSEYIRYGAKQITPAEVDVVLNCKVPYNNGTIYSTKTPSHTSISLYLASPKIHRVVYLSTKEDEKLEEMVGTALQLVKFDGNLNWVRDYVKNLKPSHK
jgi:hypothetical protein